MQSFAFSQVCHVMEPARPSGKGWRGLLSFCGDFIFFFDEEWYNMRVNLRDDEMVYVEHLR